jgi:hypothetical protein|tara:strand:+ start:2280 stop:2465 length:186 start_codon:yes stop_codon:yes gene_type:complete
MSVEIKAEIKLAEIEKWLKDQLVSWGYSKEDARSIGNYEAVKYNLGKIQVAKCILEIIKYE